MKLPDEIEAEIEAAIDQPLGCVSSEALGRARRIDDAAGRYIEFCKSTFPNELDLSGLSIVVDAANGAAYHIAPHVFRELGRSEENRSEIQSLMRISYAGFCLKTNNATLHRHDR